MVYLAALADINVKKVVGAEAGYIGPCEGVVYGELAVDVETRVVFDESGGPRVCMLPAMMCPSIPFLAELFEHAVLAIVGFPVREGRGWHIVNPVVVPCDERLLGYR